jgi:ferredoxin
MSMKVIVNHDQCEGHSRCQAAAPEVFEVRDDDKSYVLIDPVPEEQRANVERAARLCPKQAISIETVV